MFAVSAVMLMTRQKGSRMQGSPLEDIPEDFVCPLCGVGKDQFEKA